MSTSAKELFQACKQYGHVVDSFIPNKKSKNGKRFGFVKFINVFSEERLVNNLCTVWIDRYKLHANIARFQRSQAKRDGDGGKKNFQPAPKENFNKHESKGNGKSYMGVLTGDKSTRVQEPKSELALVLGDDCLATKVVSNMLFGRVKEFASLANLKLALTNEGFEDITIRYMGDFWVMFEFKFEESKSKFSDNISVVSWFSQITKASLDFTVEGRIAWVEVEGVPFKLWSGNTFSCIANKWGKLLDVDDQEDTCFHSKRICIHTKLGTGIKEEVKVIHRGKVYWIRENETPGWVPDFTDDSGDEEDLEDNNSNDDLSDIRKADNTGENSEGDEVPETIFEDDGYVKNRTEEDPNEENVDKSEDPFNIYPLLNKNKGANDKVHNSGSSLDHPPGFTLKEGIDVKEVSGADCNIRNDEIRKVNNKEEHTDAFSDCRDNCNSNDNGAESKVS
nr:nucleotide-binding alpha-beta plait domain-containing protein [Tanacetum cinerariifolium]